MEFVRRKEERKRKKEFCFVRAFLNVACDWVGIAGSTGFPEKENPKCPEKKPFSINYPSFALLTLKWLLVFFLDTHPGGVPGRPAFFLVFVFLFFLSSK